MTAGAGIGCVALEKYHASCLVLVVLMPFSLADRLA